MQEQEQAYQYFLPGMPAVQLSNVAANHLDEHINLVARLFQVQPCSLGAPGWMAVNVEKERMFFFSPDVKTPTTPAEPYACWLRLWSHFSHV